LPAEVTLQSFAPVVGESFDVDAGNAGKLELKLVDASAKPGDPNAPRAPFGLTFSGPPDTVLTQGTYLFEHPALGTFEIFIVPFTADGEGAGYEAIFA
jgi:hypothetical protein